MPGTALLLAERLGGAGFWAQPRGQAALMLFGLGALAVTLLLLMLTRWGQAKTLSKCAALSVMAHMLLLAAACGVQLFQEVPLPQRDEVLQLSIAAIDPEEAPRPAEAPPPRPWDEVPDAPPIAPPPPLVEPRAIRAEASLERTPTADDLSPTSDALLPDPAAMPASDPSPLPPAELPPPDFPDARTPPPIESPLTSPGEAPESESADDPRPAEEPLPASGDAAESGSTDGTAAASPQRMLEPFAPSAEAAVASDAVERLDAADDGRRLEQTGIAAPAAEAATDQAAIPAGVAAVIGTHAWRRVHDTPIPAPYQPRLAEDRSLLLERFSGGPETERAVQAALAWLAAHQSPDGRWNCAALGGSFEARVLGHDRGGAGIDADTGITGLALLALLGAGHTHQDGPYAAHVQAGLAFLIRSQAADGNLAGSARLFARMYCHGMALLALSEAYAMSGEPQLRLAVERAVVYTVRAQHPVSGGWRYLPGDDGDMSQFGWQLMALRSAEIAGIPLPSQLRPRMVTFLGRVAAGPYGGLASYRPGSGPTPTMTAESLACHLFLDTGLSPAAIEEAVRYLLQQTPQAGPVNLYYWYYATIAMFQLQGEPWQLWNRELKSRLLPLQETQGPHAGSWPTDDVWGGYGGRVYTTAMAAMCLEVYYRHLPLFAAETRR